MAQRRAMMTQWADYLGGLGRGETDQAALVRQSRRRRKAATHAPV
jgi:hypothetical protein